MKNLTAKKRSNIIEAVFSFIAQHDKTYATKFTKLNIDKQLKAALCIQIHRKNCQRINVPFDLGAVKEIITDANSNLFFLLENERERRMSVVQYYPSAQSSLKLVPEMI